MTTKTVTFDYIKKVIFVHSRMSEKEIWKEIMNEFYKPENMDRKMPAVLVTNFGDRELYMVNDWSMVQWLKKE